MYRVAEYPAVRTSPYGDDRAKTTVVPNPLPAAEPVVGVGFGRVDFPPPDEHAASATTAKAATTPANARTRATLTAPQPVRARARFPEGSEAVSPVGDASVAANARG